MLKSLSLGELLLQLSKLVLTLPQLLISHGFGLDLLLELCFKVLNGLLDILLTQSLLHLDLISSTIINDLVLRLAFLSILFSALRLTFNSQVPTLHDPLFCGHAVTELFIVGNDK